jgi:hypothetical protein
MGKYRDMKLGGSVVIDVQLSMEDHGSIGWNHLMPKLTPKAD